MENKWTLNHVLWRINKTEITYINNFCLWSHSAKSEYVQCLLSNAKWIMFIYSFFSVLLYCCILPITSIVWNKGFTKTQCSTNLLWGNLRLVLSLPNGPGSAFLLTNLFRPFRNVATWWVAFGALFWFLLESCQERLFPPIWNVLNPVLSVGNKNLCGYFFFISLNPGLTKVSFSRINNKKTKL